MKNIMLYFIILCSFLTFNVADLTEQKTCAAACFEQCEPFKKATTLTCLNNIPEGSTKLKTLLELPLYQPCVLLCNAFCYKVCPKVNNLINL